MMRGWGMALFTFIAWRADEGGRNGGQEQREWCQRVEQNPSDEAARPLDRMSKFRMGLEVQDA
eukprot:2378565-Rhodomonas_salina.1